MEPKNVPPSEPTAARLIADFTLRREDFRLQVHLTVGTEVLVLFGPSGSGKTTTLNAIAGLITPERGHVTLDGQILFRHDGGRRINVPARHRGIGFVFQHYALFPHLTALQNVAYPLRGSAGQSRARELLERMNLGHLAYRYPHELSGGQQQRVAIARALAASPRVLLLDEPFSALDAGARQRLQAELAGWQRELGLAVIYVTHRLEDAFVLGQRLAVMRDGRVEQAGPIEEVFRYPASPQVAEIMGLPNLFRARVIAARADGLVMDWDGLELVGPPQALTPGATVTAYVRPEDIKVLYPDRPLVDAIRYNQAVGRIVAIGTSPGGRVIRAVLANGHQIELFHGPYTYARLDLQVGDEVRLSLRREALVVIGTGKV